MALYSPALDRDNCGFGLIAHMDGEPSHRVVRTGIGALARMAHRGGVAADGRTGDGCGLLLQKPDSFFSAIAAERGWTLGNRYAVGMLFLSRDPARAGLAREVLEEELTRLNARPKAVPVYESSRRF